MKKKKLVKRVYLVYYWDEGDGETYESSQKNYILVTLSKPRAEAALKANPNFYSMESYELQ